MVISCAAFGCTNRFQKGGIPFHKFPKDSTLRKKWLIAIKRTNFKPSQWTAICGNHFTDADYHLSVVSEKKILNITAVPSVFNFPEHLLKPVKQRRVIKKVIPEDIDISTIASTSSSIVNPTVVDPDTFSTTDTTKMGVSTVNIPVKGMETRKRKRVFYPGDFTENDLESPSKRHHYWITTQKVLRTARKNYKYLHCKVIRQKKRITNLNALIDDLNKKTKLSSENALVLKECIPEAEKQLLFRQLKGGSGKFPPQLRCFALTLNYYSSSAYNYVRNMFGKNSLPHPRTLIKWYSSIDGSPGYTAEAIRAVANKVKFEKDKGKSLIAGLVVDEMSIKEYTELVGSRNFGFINFGVNMQHNDLLPRATKALVFMLVALNAKWKIPIAYFLINNISAEERATLLKGCLIQVHETGILIKSITFDGCPSNLSMASILGANLYWPNLQPYFLHPMTNEKIHVILDACHMIKLCRNTLGDWGILYDEENNTVKWKYFENLVKLQDDSGLHAATKIRRRHLNYNAEKMKVKLAVQTFSASVADAIEYCNKDLDMLEFKYSEGTVQFCRNLNNIFDFLNTRNFLSSLIYKKPLVKESEAFLNNFIDQSIRYLSKLKDPKGGLIIQSGRKCGFLGLIVCLTSVRNLYNELVVSSKLKFLMTYKLSQDHLEMFFSVIRSRGGFNDNPTARQFEGAYKRLLVHTEIASPDSANCLAQDTTSILFISSKQQKIVNVLDSLNDVEIPDIEIDNILVFLSNCIYLTDVIEYIAGFVSKKIVQNLNCEICAKSLTSTNSFSLLLNRKNRGFLHKPSKDIVKICTIAESVFRYFNNYSQHNILNILILTGLRKLNISELFPELSEHCIDQDPLNGHLLQLIKLILKTYFTIRLNYVHKTKNEVNFRIRQKFTKLIQFKNQ